MSEDLSTKHAPVGDLFKLPQSRGEWARYRLSDEQVAFYDEHGYVAGIRVLDERQLERLRAELNELLDPAHPLHYLFYEFHSNESRSPERVVFHALGSWRISAGFHDLLWHPAFTVPASQLLKGAVRFWHDQLFCKPAHCGGVVAWHQDYSYWTRTVPIAHVSCWIGLDDSTRENGCIHYVAGSHRWQLLPATRLADDMDAIQSVLSEDQRRDFRPIAVELKAGEASFHHPLVVHGSYENTTGEARRAVVINAFRDGVRSASAAPPLAGVPPVPVGEKMCGRFFPLLFDPKEISA